MSSNWPVEVVIVDYDLEGLDDDEIRNTCFDAAEVNTDVVRQVFTDISR